MPTSIAMYAVIVYAVFAAITQLGIAVERMAPTFLILLEAIVLSSGYSVRYSRKGAS